MQQHRGKKHQHHKTTHHTKNLMCTFPIHRGNREMAELIWEITDIRGGIEEKNEKSIDEQQTTHLYYTRPQHHLLEHKTAPGPHQQTPLWWQGIWGIWLLPNYSTYLVSYIWFATMENKWEKKKKITSAFWTLSSFDSFYFHGALANTLIRLAELLFLRACRCTELANWVVHLHFFVLLGPWVWAYRLSYLV